MNCYLTVKYCITVLFDISLVKFLVVVFRGWGTSICHLSSQGRKQQKELDKIIIVFFSLSHFSTSAILCSVRGSIVEA